MVINTTAIYFITINYCNVTQMTNRREFLKHVAAASMIATFPEQPFFLKEEKVKTENPLIWANLVHLGFNMWADNTPAKFRTKNPPSNDCTETKDWANWYHPDLTFDKTVWDKTLDRMAEVGMNMVVIDLGDGVKYNSHPEIAVTGAWSPSQLKKELKRIKEIGLEPIPKLNFSTGHKAWLGPYQRMISSKKYYNVCKNLIEEVSDLFDTPRFFHLGMDEETAMHQKTHENVVIRQGDLWWHDFYYLIDLVEKQNIRSWIWSDYAWHNPDLFFEKMPKSVLQSNWYYTDQFEKVDHPLHQLYVSLYGKLEEHGYDQVPTGSNYYNDVNFGRTVEYCSKIINPDRLKGFMQSTWHPTLPACLDKHIDAINQVSEAMNSKPK